jgi:hypothetical protein
MPSYSQETVLEQKRIRLGLYLSTFSAGCGRVVELADAQDLGIGHGAISSHFISLHTKRAFQVP